ncbi:hypothetical protein [Robertmurraya massiliosenegalensis]|uniref:hypothetical protein n=1 Tax=Robertmurraya massiliosenegalensis TaxID=1287657 RepID=UPI000376C690|nr:hypothetical protein [Robertmurraya massiliosenegalensis]
MDIQKTTKLRNQLEYINRSSNKMEHHLRNSIEVELLMHLEEEGLGHWTISQLLNHLQEMNANGETESFYALENRKKRV